MAQRAKSEVQLELKCSAQSFYEIFRSKQHLLPKVCPELIKDINVIKGDWESLGSIKQWAYNVPAGNCEAVEEALEAIDDENKRLTFKLLDGEITKYYKNVKSTIQVTGKDEGGSSVKWSLEYEKQNEDLPEPIKYLDLFPVLTKSVDAYLNKNA
ncbi:Bet v I type allergen [Parasponia andersonii]|uniref:Bet v I type allergen n=1 Tax=Parasponia andersonii TaxID=3476 RepID=A0A2P5BWX1_PARAD|nr:Bet v I type allergen [Parasponia andersonii]